MSDLPLEQTLRRLKQERDEADRRYNDALTELDHSIRPPVGIPDPEPGLDDQKVAALNDAWNIVPSPPAMPGLKGRLAGFIWRTVGPYLQRQLRFNSIVVEHVNRNADARRAAHRRDREALAAIRAQMHQLAAFQGRLMVLLQQITAYVDTRDRDAAGGSLVLNAALSSLAEAQGKYRESLEAREHRSEARVTAVAAGHEELRGMIGVNQQAIVAVKRALEEGPLRTPGTPRTPRTLEASGDAFAPSLDAYKYVGFEDQFRGSREVIRERLESYVPHFQNGPGGDLLDVGCGRGEFLDLLAAHGIQARGIDLNHEMAEGCRARGLNVAEADAVRYLTMMPDDSLGGVFAAQVVEHLEPAYLLRFLEVAFEKLQPGGRMILETLNPACWTAFFESYIRDITHRCPLHPETLKYLVLASGFSRADIEFRSPVPTEDRLQPIAAAAGTDEAATELAETFNANVDKLNARMFTHMDYAIVAEKTSTNR